MQASSSVGKIGVHVLSEFIFCQRAGLNAYLEGQSDDGRDPILRLDYAPCYEFEKLEKRLSQLATGLWQLGALTGSFVILGILLGFWAHWSLFVGGLVASGYVGYRFVLDLREAWHLLRQYKEARGTPALEPLPHTKKDEMIHWWEMRAAGFVSQPCNQALEDTQIGLVGRPWRILRRGEMAIPVFVRKRTEGALRPQQRARIEAYCHLIRINERAESPYGIVLNGGTMDGMAVKTSPAAFGPVRMRFVATRNMLNTYFQHDQTPEIPNSDSICSKCPHGRPRELVAGKSDTITRGRRVVPTSRQSHIDGKLYHSSCGDRFEWTPPHIAATRKGLLHQDI